ncbi:hypothetical protein D3C86_1682970 [compost metagenome]
MRIYLQTHVTRFYDLQPRSPASLYSDNGIEIYLFRSADQRDTINNLRFVAGSQAVLEEASIDAHNTRQFDRQFVLDGIGGSEKLSPRKIKCVINRDHEGAESVICELNSRCRCVLRGGGLATSHQERTGN